MVIIDFIKFLGTNSFQKNKYTDKFIPFTTLFLFTFIIVSSIKILLKNTIDLPEHIPLRFDIYSFKLVLYTIFIGPAFEEAMFRLNLEYSKINLSISFGFITQYIFQLIYANFFSSAIIWIISIIIFPLIFYIILNSGKGNLDFYLSKFWHKNNKIIFYISAFLFAFMHLSNHIISNLHDLFALIILNIPFILLGLVLGYIRICFGFAWSIFFHALNNLIIVLFIYIVNL